MTDPPELEPVPGVLCTTCTTVSPHRLALEDEKIELEIEKLKIESRKAEAELFAVGRANDWNERVYADKHASPDEALVFTFYESVTPDTVQGAMLTLSRWHRREPGRAITIVFNSPGGRVLDGFALYDHLRFLSSQGHEITTVALGMAASMGGILMQAGDIRVAGANAQLLIHEVTSGAIGNVSELKDEAEFAAALWKRCTDLLAQRSTMSAAQIRSKAKRTDWWMGADEAKRLGFIDRIQD